MTADERDIRVPSEAARSAGKIEDLSKGCVENASL